MTDVFEEVEENLRRDQYARFFRRNAVALIAGLVALLAGVGGYQVYLQWRGAQSQTYAERLAAASDLANSGDVAGAEKQFADIAKSSPAGYKTVALLQQGGALAAQGDLKGAIGAYDRAAATAPAGIFKDLAKLKAAYAAADVENFKTLQARVKPLIDANGPFSYLARELIGMQAFAAGDAAGAREQFEYLSLALETPEGVRQRAQSALAVMGPKPTGASAPADAPKPAAKTGDKK